MYILRLDDAAEHMNVKNWNKMEKLLNRYEIKPIYGIIPNNRDPELLRYSVVDGFWDLMKKWEENGWLSALHGDTHVFETEEGGINPVHHKSEFAGLSLEYQREKIREGYKILLAHGIKPDIFFAPAHTFDVHTLKALYMETSIRVINDTVADDIYYKKPFYFIPQQSGKVRKLPFHTVTFCYHPNTMNDHDFNRLERFIYDNKTAFTNIDLNLLKPRKIRKAELAVRKVYFARRIVNRRLAGK